MMEFVDEEPGKRQQLTEEEIAALSRQMEELAARRGLRSVETVYKIPNRILQMVDAKAEESEVLKHDGSRELSADWEIGAARLITKGGKMIGALYGAIVDADGSGDFTDIQSAIDAGATSIFVRSGTYTLTADVSLPDGAVLVGEDPKTTIIDGDAAYQVKALGASESEFSHLRISNLTFQNGNSSKAIVYLYYCDYSMVENCFFNINSGRYALHFYYCDYSNTQHNIFKSAGSSKDGLKIEYGSYAVVQGNEFEFTSGNGLAISIGSLYTTVIGNTIKYGQYGIYINQNECTVIGNITQFTTYPIYIGDSDVTVIGNNVDGLSAGNATIDIKQENCLVVGNWVRRGRIRVASGKVGNIIAHNYIYPNSAGSLAIEDLGTGTIIRDNVMDTCTPGPGGGDDKSFKLMKNTSGGSLVAGDVVILKSVANGYEVTTTTTHGDDKVFGMLEIDTANNAFGLVQTIGKTTKLKVNGTEDIAIGDFLCTFTVAGIACKAGAGDMAFAIALEAYTDDDSNGVIDALLIKPIKYLPALDDGVVKSSSGIFSGGYDHGDVGGLTDDDHTHYVLADGTRALSGDWDIGDGRKIQADAIWARDGDGLGLYDDAGNGIFVEDGGQIGIGTAEPLDKLHIAGAIAGGDANTSIYLEQPANTVGSRVRLVSGVTGGTNPYFAIEARHGSNPWDIRERLRIDQNGNVGIGTNAPVNPLTISSSVPVLLGLHEEDSGVGEILFTNSSDADGWYIGITGAEKFGISRNIDMDAGGEFIIQQDGNVGIGTNAPTAKLDVNSDILRLRTAKTPASAGAAGNAGDICWDSSYLYVCIATNTWRRIAHATW